MDPGFGGPVLHQVLRYLCFLAQNKTWGSGTAQNPAIPEVTADDGSSGAFGGKERERESEKEREREVREVREVEREKGRYGSCAILSIGRVWGMYLEGFRV